MVGKDDMPSITPNEKKDEKLKPKPAVLKEPVGLKKPDTVMKEPVVVTKADTVGIIKPGEKKQETVARIPVVGKPLVIEPDQKVRPAMPEVKLKGKAGKKIELGKKPKKDIVEKKSLVLTLMVFVCFVLVAGGTALLVLEILDIPAPDWTEPVINLYSKIPIFPE